MADTAPLPIRALDFVTKKVPDFVINHPVLSAGTIGVILGANAMRKPAYRVEDSLQAERLGIPGSKYEREDLHKFSALKEFLEVKCAYEKTAQKGGSHSQLPIGEQFPRDIMGGIGSGIGQGAAATGMQGILGLLGRGAQSIHEKFVQDPKREKILDKAMSEDPMLSNFEANNPGAILRHYQTLVRFAPTLSTDPNVVTSYLRATAPLGGSMDPTVIKGLAEAEIAALKAKNEGRWGSNFGGRR